MDASAAIDALSSNRFGRIVRQVLTSIPVFGVLPWLRAMRPAILLDIGSGKGESIPGLASLRGSGSMPDTYTVGLDLFLPYTMYAKRRGFIDDAVLADARKLPFRTKSTDVSLIVEVLEHLTKNEGKKLLEDAESVTRKMIMATTPNGYLPQNHYDDNPYQRHASGWNLEDLVARGYKVYGLSGLKWFRRERGGLPLRGFLGFVLLALSYLTQTMTFFVPRVAFRLLALKVLK